MILRLAILTLLAALPAGCESCDFSFGARVPIVDVLFMGPDGRLTDEQIAAVVEPATVAVCRRDHDGTECTMHPLDEVLDDSERPDYKLLLDAVYDGESYAHLTRCWVPGLEVTITAPGCSADSVELGRTRADKPHDVEVPAIEILCPA